jgi:N-acylneuraminate cytidylyltransferase
MSLPLVALVPARAGSKGLPGKNLAPLAGRPLWRHAVEHGLAAGARVVVSTDIEEILAEAPPAGVALLRRPAALAADDTPMDAVIAHALAEAVPGEALVVLLQPTSPLRLPGDVARAAATWREGRFDLVLSATPGDPGVLKWGRAEGARFLPLADPAFCFANRQTLPAVWRPDGAVYVFSAGWFRAAGRLAAARRIGMVEMPPERALDIDTAEDLARAEALLSRRGPGG